MNINLFKFFSKFSHMMSLSKENTFRALTHFTIVWNLLRSSNKWSRTYLTYERYRHVCGVYALCHMLGVM